MNIPAIPPEAYFSFLTLGSSFLLSRLVTDKISQFYFNWLWQHVVSDKKHIFFRDCNHQLGSFFLAPPSSWTYLEKETAACGLLNARELNLKKRERKSHTGKQLKNTFRKPVCVYMHVCVSIELHQLLCSHIIYMQN